jgi:hypothetical protein
VPVISCSAFCKQLMYFDSVSSMLLKWNVMFVVKNDTDVGDYESVDDEAVVGRGWVGNASTLSPQGRWHEQDAIELRWDSSYFEAQIVYKALLGQVVNL